MCTSTIYTATCSNVIIFSVDLYAELCYAFVSSEMLYNKMYYGNVGGSSHAKDFAVRDWIGQLITITEDRCIPYHQSIGSPRFIFGKHTRQHSPIPSYFFTSLTCLKYMLRQRKYLHIKYTVDRWVYWLFSPSHRMVIESKWNFRYSKSRSTGLFSK